MAGNRNGSESGGLREFRPGEFPDDRVSRLCSLHDDEWPMLLIELSGRSIPVSNGPGGKSVWYGGRANQISERKSIVPEIDRIHLETKLSRPTRGEVASSEPSRYSAGAVELPPPASSSRRFGQVARMRRSALNFVGGSRS